ncbi:MULTISPECIES: hypothetical protein [Paenibacillus]|uniref:Uncharacterized protein n=3 Tax=Paenibacillus TaxID=44249 RepID=A0A1R0XDR6_9BACL|nr:hypothetical protein [Paenibacillus odorifer]ETT45453.1 hypothetical protein C171_32191 [Paenibacillus sp. FSL H8-237]OMD33186.1 hypothetical protein BJP51_12550 [Paenibacillus odorifer]OME59665.1 hypothetical protein BSK66_09965 [Paenibacillus odorifer]
MSDNKIEVNKNEEAGIIFENSHCLCKKDNIDFEVMYMDSFSNSDYKLHLTYEGDQLQLVKLQTIHKDNRESESIFMDNYSKLMTSLFIEDYIYNDMDFYKKMLGDKYAADGYYLSQRIVEAFFNRFFT